MKLSLIFELLLIFILLAFAASKSVRKEKNNAKKAIQTRNEAVTAVEQLEDNSINKYCKCAEAFCNCCREFRLPVVELNGPGCASLRYINGDKMSVSLSFGRKVITNRTLSSRKPSPVCMPLPGGISKFCGRVYNIARSGEEFRACLGLELQSKSSVEAAVRVSCFKFGPRGVSSEPADPLPLVPQDEKAEDDDDDDYDDEDDAFGLGADDDEEDDDDDDEDDGTIDAVNDVDSADYTGFSLLGEDLLGDLFGGSTGGKKGNKNRKKQAPPPSTTTTTSTTTTRRPRPTRPRPTRRPSTRSTTPRTTRTTTVRNRPTTGNRRPTRRPSRRPSRRPTTPITTTSILTSTTARTTPILSSVTIPIQTTERNVISTSVEQTFEPIEPIPALRPATVAATTSKTVTNFEDPGLEMSLAHITGQLSALPVTPMISNEGKDSGEKEPEQTNYEKVQTITPKTPSTIPVVLSSAETVNDDMIQIVQSLEESSLEREPSGQESQVLTTVSDSEDMTTLKKKTKKQFNLSDLDVLDLTRIGESIGDELGIFGKNKRNNKKTKVKGEKEQSDDYDAVVDTIGDAFLMRKSENTNENKRDRRRQNKMMRGEWS